MAAAEVGTDGLAMPTDELDALLGLPSSGVYAFITSRDGEVLWRMGTPMESGRYQKPGQFRPTAIADDADIVQVDSHAIDFEV